VDELPPVPPSATYSTPSGPKASPRGLFSPDATTVIFDSVRACAEAEAVTRHIAVIATAAVKQAGPFRILPPSRPGRVRNCLVM
jgi:hypothetical protein